MYVVGVLVTLLIAMSGWLWDDATERLRTHTADKAAHVDRELFDVKLKQQDERLVLLREDVKALSGQVVVLAGDVRALAAEVAELRRSGARRGEPSPAWPPERAR